MSTLRTLVVVAVLVAIGYMVYATLHRQPPAGPPEGAPDEWAGAPIVEMPGDLAAAPSFADGESYIGPSAPSYPSGEAAGFAAQTPTAQGSAASPWVEVPQTSSVDRSHHDHQHGDAPAVATGGGAPANAPPSSYAPAPSTQQFPPPQAMSPNAQIAGDRYADFPNPNVATGTRNPLPAGPRDASDFSAGGQPNPAAPTQVGLPAPANSFETAPPDAYRQSPSQFAAALQQTQAMLDQGQIAEAHLGLSAWYEVRNLPESDRAKLLELLDQLAGTVIYAQMHLLEPAYEVQPGDTLQSVGAVYNVPWQLLAKINGISDPSRLQSGQLLKVVRGPFSATLDLDQHFLTLWLGDRYAGRFRIGVGRDHSTPEGEFYVQEKVTNPTYYGPDGVVDKDDPTNPLGERWIDLGHQLGIHGTIDPTSIGSDVSRGCVRLSPRDIEDVYDILSKGSKVIIRR